MKRDHCDACDAVIAQDTVALKFRVKKRWYSWEDSGWSYVTLCKGCFSSIQKVANTKMERLAGTL